MTSRDTDTLILEGLGTLQARDISWDADRICAVIADSSAPAKARINACEALFARAPLPTCADKTTLAEIYAGALQTGVAGELNEWGYLSRGEIGLLGLHLVACGAAAVASLAPLLGDGRPAGVYAGSKEATLGARDSARICDFAAYFVAAILGVPYVFHRRDIAARDAEIARLKEALAHVQRPASM